jgi:phosphoribosylamine--glycine ligase
LPTNVLVVGSGAREHALAWKLAESAGVASVFCAPGNAGTALIAECLPVQASDFDGLARAIEARGIDLTVVGPEEPLARGLADALQERGHLVFGPTAAAARIESSKAWAKEVMAAAGVAAGRAVTCDTLPAALDAVYDAPLPIVVKADGLAAGKGVVICETRAAAESAVRAMIEDRTLGDAAGRVLIEEFLEGIEVSLLALTDGEAVVPLLPACDYKKIGDGDTGPNTGGMGAYTPPAAVDATLASRLADEVIAPVVREMAHRDITYRGVLYAGLILTASGPMVLEFNCRFGDPETQVILPMLASDMLELCDATARGTLASASPPAWHPGACVGVVLASGGYPGSYSTGHVVDGLDALPEGGLVFHAGTAQRNGDIVTSGGRVLTCAGRGPDMAAARALAYATAKAISFEGAYKRGDIARREIE